MTGPGRICGRGDQFRVMRELDEPEAVRESVVFVETHEARDEPDVDPDVAIEALHRSLKFLHLVALYRAAESYI